MDFNAYEAARAQYAALGVDTDAAMKTLAGVPVSIHCWQGDDVHGFENGGPRFRAAFRRPATTRAARAASRSSAPIF